MMIVDKVLDLLRVLRFRARALLRKEEADAEMDEEMRFHLEMEMERARLPTKFRPKL
jgi:hypothetical protein